ncbi:MAG: hypothetical protein F4X64_08610 [Chloroflexi bacterium]|nr:hypothetical protein [Chloroflexota bacterium]
MPITEVTILRRCGHCRQELGEMTVKKDNMRLMVSDLVWCDPCGAETPEVREIAGRQSAVAAEQASYPGNPPVLDVSAAEYRRRKGRAFGA